MAAMKPNILIYLTDQQRGDHLGIAGHPMVRTPYSDALVGRGAYFPNAHTEVPSTTAAHRMILCGRGNYHCGQVGYSAAHWDNHPPLLSEVLAGAGYHCFRIGWNNLHPQRALYGFHTVLNSLILGAPDESEYAEWLRREAGPAATTDSHCINNNGWLARPWPMEERLHAVAWTVDATLDQIKKRDPQRPFFAWCSHYPPHSPYCPPQAYWDMYANRDIPGPVIGDWAERHNVCGEPLEIGAWRGKMAPDEHRRMRAGYMGACAHVDYEFGRLLTRLGTMKLMDNTLVVRISDHGDMQGDHYLYRKTYAYEGSSRIVFLLQYPKGLDAPRGVFHHLVGLQDVMPTILDVAGAPFPKGMTGRSVLGAVRGEPWREFFHGEHSPTYHSADTGSHYLTDAKEKYIWFPATGEEQFFDLAKDPNELRDLGKSAAAAGRLALWRGRLVELLAKRGDGFSDGKRLLLKPEGWKAEVGAVWGEGNAN